MKTKFFSLVLATSVLFIFSCTSENEVTTGDKVNHLGFKNKSLSISDLDRAKQLYIDMMASQEYVDFKTSVSNFNTTLAQTNISFTNKNDWMNWILTNVSSTNFTSISHFEQAYDDMVSKAGALVAANTTLYEYLGKTDKAQFMQILEPARIISPTPEPNQITCQGCYDACDTSLDHAWFNYVDAEFIAVIGYALTGGNIESILAPIEQAYWDACFAAEYNLNMCLSNCV